MFISRNLKNNVYPFKPWFYGINKGFKWGGGGSKLYRYVFVMGVRIFSVSTEGKISLPMTKVYTIPMCHE